jgi:Protein of unknown function (DUF3829)
MPRRVSRIGVLLLVCSLPLVGCKRLFQEMVEARRRALDAGAGGASAQVMDEDQALGEKLNGYIRECLNRFSKVVHATEERYFSWADPKKGPTGRERNVYGLQEISLDPEQCRVAVSKSNAANPKKPDIERIADAYAAALSAVVPIVNEAHKYYERGDYKSDKMAKAKQLHPKLLAAFQSFDKADADLSQLVDEIQEQLDRRELVRIERDEGKKLHWYIVNTTLVAKQVLHEGAKDLAKINLPALTAASDNFEKAVDAFEAWANQNKSEAANASNFLRAAKELVLAGKNLVRHIREKKPYSAAEKSRMGTSSGWMVDGSPDQVLDRYNKLVDAYNSVR